MYKRAFFGDASVSGSPTFSLPPPTVGQAMYGIGGNMAIPSDIRRQALDGIVGSGATVASPLSSLLHSGAGALVGNFIATRLGVGPFTRGIFTATGAEYGKKLFG